MRDRIHTVYLKTKRKIIWNSRIYFWNKIFLADIHQEILYDGDKYFCTIVFQWPVCEWIHLCQITVSLRKRCAINLLFYGVNSRHAPIFFSPPRVILKWLWKTLKLSSTLRFSCIRNLFFLRYISSPQIKLHKLKVQCSHVFITGYNEAASFFMSTKRKNIWISLEKSCHFVSNSFWKKQVYNNMQSFS